MYSTMNKKKIIVILRDNESFNQLKEILSTEYELLEISDKIKAKELIHNDSERIVGLLFEANRAIADDFSFTRSIAEDMRFVQITSIAVSLKKDHDEIISCINNDINEYIAAPFDKELTLLRIRNAIRSKDSTTFGEIENILKELPSNIYFKDTHARYVFVTHLWHHVKVGNEPNWTIRGKTDLDVRKDKENALKAYQSDLDIIRNDKGTSYIIEENNDGMKEYLELIKMPTHDENGNVTGIIALINDVTEKQTIKKELEKRSTTDFLTGLMNRRACQEEIERQLRLSDKGTMLMIDVDNFKHINDTYGHGIGDEVLVKVAKIIKKSIRGSDIVGRMGGDEFIAFLCGNANKESAVRVSGKIIESIREDFSDKEYGKDVSASIGIAVCDKQELSFENMYSLADKALYKVKENTKGTYSF
ncbi:MAG: GGDEF domain-containing protein [Erysipelotrichaceae bacterium]|nr:GGDEF domain-containing protein [Erysipelotrichaceae bacterium]